jgi:hypothetical protein
MTFNVEADPRDHHSVMAENGWVVDPSSNTRHLPRSMQDPLLGWTSTRAVIQLLLSMQRSHS